MHPCANVQQVQALRHHWPSETEADANSLSGSMRRRKGSRGRRTPPPPAEVGEESEKDLKNGEERQKKVEIAKASRMRKGERRRGRETEVGDTVRMTFRSFQLTKS